VAEEPSGRESEPGAELGPLPGGIHGLSRDQVAESQRERLLAAVTEIVLERGYDAASVTELVRVASVSSRDFYRHFDSAEACFLAAYDAVLGHFRRSLDAAAAPCTDWPERVVAALRAALRFAAGRPDLARFCLIEPVAATPAIALRHRDAVLAFAPLLATGRDYAPAARRLPPSTEESLLGGLIGATSRPLLEGDPAALPDLLPDLVEFVLSPYLGAERAGRIAASCLEEDPTT
jgi:AcrR family transcriptional regulator